MTAVQAYKEHESNLIDCGTKEKFLRVAAVYGANASGKSNLYFAMRYFQQIIKKSLNNGDHTTIEEYYYPFSLEEDSGNSEFQIALIIGNYEYRYGYEYNETDIAAEWLYRKSLKTNRTAVIFERAADTVRFGASVRKECEVYKEQMPSETLVLSFFNKLKLKTDLFRTVYEEIMHMMTIRTEFCEVRELLERILPKVIDREKEKLMDFLSAIDTGIKDIKYDENDRRTEFTTIHTGRDHKAYALDLYSESEGTIKSIILFTGQ